jgi:hypothetical protein
MKTRIPPVLITFTLVCFTLVQNTQAVSPAPDGGYPGGNTAEGQAALLSLTSGGFNTAVGFLSLRSDTTNSFNTAVGAGTLLVNTGDSNTATGVGALLSNTTGTFNTANGVFALFSNIDGQRNNSVGFNALASHTTGSYNNAVGAFALYADTAGVSNNAFGDLALNSNTTGTFNTAIGDSALELNTTGSNNTAIGVGALVNVGGELNTAIGSQAGSNVVAASGVICIGANVVGADVTNTCFIGNIRGTTTQNNDAIPVLIDSAGQLGTVSSSRRFKTDIKPIDKASECVLGLKPVSFRYKIHKDAKPQFGLIAEEVAQVNRDLVIYDADGRPYTVRYDAVNAMLLNEFLKAHRKVEGLTKEFQAAIAQQQKQIEALTAGLQKVSAQLEASKPAPQVVNNP